MASKTAKSGSLNTKKKSDSYARDSFCYGKQEML